MKILTLNAHAWHEENQLEKIRELAKAITENDYDVVAMQEVNQLVVSPMLADGHHRENNYGLVLMEEIEKLGGPKYHYYWERAKIVRDTFEEGSCILTKSPMVEKEWFAVSTKATDDFLKTRKIMRVTIMHENEPIDLYSCHMGWWHDEIEPFKPQIDRLLSHLNPNRRAFLMGDFNNNANIKGEGYTYMLEHGLKDTYVMAKEKDCGTTVKGEISGWKDNTHHLRIDLIVTNQVADVAMSRVIFNDTNRMIISDHYGVETELVF